MVGFRDKDHYRYFESEPTLPEESGSAVDQFMRWLLADERYRGVWLYAHNGGNFDVLYILKWMIAHAGELYRFELIPVQSTILSLEVLWKNERQKSGQGKGITFLDSFRLMSASLDKLGQAFGLGGKVPNIDYDTLHLDERRYEYLERDCTLLYRCVEHFHSLIYNAGGDVAMTAPGVAMQSFRRKFLNEPIPANRHFPNCEDPECQGCLHAFVRSAYAGGRVEVFTERFDGPGEISMGDVNSMYPAMMLENVPIDFSHETTGPVDIGKKERAGYLGFIKCKVLVPRDSYLPPLPLRYDGKLIFPVGTFEGTFTSTELTAHLESGGKILEYGRAAWFRGKPIFKDYVEHWYRYRDKTAPGYTQAMDMLAKLLLNSLYGKMGMNETREKIWFNPTEDDFTKHDLTPISEIFHGVYTEEVRVEVPYVIPHIAAWITAKARIHLWRLMADRVKAGETLFYCDTDSIVSSGSFKDASGLGGIKLAAMAKRARFVAPKMYFMVKPDGKEDVKAKGFTAGFGGSAMTVDTFQAIVDKRVKVTVQRMRKFREALNSGERFPSMKTVTKGVNFLDDKREHMPDGSTRPKVIEDLTQCSDDVNLPF